MALNKCESYKSYLFLVLKTCQNQNPGEDQLRDVSLAARHPSHQNKIYSPDKIRKKKA